MFQPKSSVSNFPRLNLFNKTKLKTFTFKAPHLCYDMVIRRNNNYTSVPPGRCKLYTNNRNIWPKQQKLTIPTIPMTYSDPWENWKEIKHTYNLWTNKWKESQRKSHLQHPHSIEQTHLELPLAHHWILDGALTIIHDPSVSES